MRRHITLAVAFAALLPCLHPVSAAAETSDERAHLTEVSLREALGGRRVPLLAVEPVAGGRDGQLARLVAVLSSSADRRIHVRNPGRTSVSTRSTMRFAADGSWSLAVMGDGSRFRYRGNIDDEAELEAAAGGGRLDLATLEQLGREFVTTRLASLVALPANERLVFLGSKYLREAGGGEGDEIVTSEVVANVATFGREVAGTFVAGPGSKIAVWFSNVGEPIGFFVDWPTYRVTGQTQATLHVQAVWRRLALYGSHPVKRMRANMRRFECGYVDQGVFRRLGASIQPGCLAFHGGPIPGGLTYAAIDSVPIGTRVVIDAGWPVTRFVATNRPWDLCRYSPEGCREPRQTRNDR